VIRLPEGVLREIEAHGREAYPEECCGALLGTAASGGCRVEQAERTSNASSLPRNRRYEVAPQEYLRIDRLARSLGLDVQGFYHSHPDHPAAPSEYDRERALPFFHYLVVAVDSGTPAAITSWVLSEDRGTFEPEELRVEGPGR